MDILSVSAITARIKDRLEELPAVTIEGEVSNARKPNASGHLYFTLGDADTPPAGQAPAKLNAYIILYFSQKGKWFYNFCFTRNHPPCLGHPPCHRPKRRPSLM